MKNKHIYLYTIIKKWNGNSKKEYMVVFNLYTPLCWNMNEK